MRWPTGIEFFLASWAVLASAFSWHAMNNFIERSYRMNDLTDKLSKFEFAHGCLGKEIDKYFWVGDCPTTSFGDARETRTR